MAILFKKHALLCTVYCALLGLAVTARAGMNGFTCDCTPPAGGGACSCGYPIPLEALGTNQARFRCTGSGSVYNVTWQEGDHIRCHKLASTVGWTESCSNHDAFHGHTANVTVYCQSPPSLPPNN